MKPYINKFIVLLLILASFCLGLFTSKEKTPEIKVFEEPHNEFIFKEEVSKTALPIKESNPEKTSTIQEEIKTEEVVETMIAPTLEHDVVLKLLKQVSHNFHSQFHKPKWRAYGFLGYGQTGVKLKVSGESFSVLEENSLLFGLGLSRSITPNISLGGFWVDTETYGAMVGYDYSNLRLSMLGAYGVKGARVRNEGEFIYGEADRGFVPGIMVDYSINKRWGVSGWALTSRSYGIGINYSFDIFK